MTLGAKILVGAAVLCLAVWFGLTALGMQPLLARSSADVIYGEGEEFYSDARVFRKLRNTSYLLVNLPHARPDYRWVAVNFGDKTIVLTGPPRSAGVLRYLLKGDEEGLHIEQQGDRDWTWRFTEESMSFSGDGFACRVGKLRK